MDLHCAAGPCRSLVREGGVKLPCHVSPAVPHYHLVRGANEATALVQINSSHAVVVYMMHLCAASQLKWLLLALSGRDRRETLSAP